MKFAAKCAEGFISLFQAGGENFIGMVNGILPTLIILITAVNAIVEIVGEDKVNAMAKKASGNFITRYTLFPLLSLFFLTNPMAYTFGRFLDEKYKPAFYDAAVSFCHPITGLFPHANSAELFVFLGIAQGVEKLGYSTGDLAVRYFISGLIVIFIRGILTEKITAIMMKSAVKKES